MSGSESAVWRDGQIQLAFVVQPGKDPVREPSRKDPRDLHPEHGFLTLYSGDGLWSVGTVMLHGRWLRKTDRQPGAREGTLAFSGPLSAADGTPEWLIADMSKLVASLNWAMRVAEKEIVS